MTDLMDTRSRHRIIQDIFSNQNKHRKSKSWKQYSIVVGDYSQYVAENLLQQFDEETVIEMPRISSINIAKKYVNRSATIYKKPPQRQWTDLSDDDQEVIKAIYKDGKLNRKLFRSNQKYKYQNQNIFSCVPKKGRLELKVYNMHHVDVVPDPEDPEEWQSVIISVNDRQLIDRTTVSEESTATGYKGPSNIYDDSEDYLNQVIADEDDYQKHLERYEVWDLPSQTNFIMDGNGAVKDPETGEFHMTVYPELLEKIKSDFITETGRLPFVDVAYDKDFTFFVKEHHSSTDFTIDFNAAFSDYADTNKMQSKAQAFVSGHPDLMANEMKVGSHLLLKLPKIWDEQSGQYVDTEFQYANPSPDMAGAKEFIESYLSLYLSSEDVGTDAVTMNQDQQKFTSGFERLLAMLDRFEASREDYELYDNAEHELWDIIKGWIAVARKADNVLDERYIPRQSLEGVDLMVEFSKPEQIRSRSEQLSDIDKEKELFLTSDIQAIADYYQITREQAEERLEQFIADEKRAAELRQGLVDGMAETQI